MLELVLIDNDLLLRKAWEKSAYNANRKILTFESTQAFLLHCGEIDPSTPIYIDSDLGNDLRGEVEAEKIFQIGFHNLFLTTAYPPEMFESQPWIRAVTGKYPPWEISPSK